jgi:hypothetical protein
MATDTEIILIALQKERDELHERILQVDRIINRVKSIDYGNTIGEDRELIPQDTQTPNITAIPFPKSADIKIQVLRVFEIMGYATSLSQLQDEYSRITGSSF